MSDTVHRYIMTYDVALDSRRLRVAKTLESYGDRIQYSVFLIDTKPAKIIRLKTTIASKMDLTTDSLLICDLGPLNGAGHQHLDFIGATRPFTGQDPLVL